MLEEGTEANPAGVASEIDTQAGAAAIPEKKQARRLPLPAHLPRREVRRELVSTTCAKCETIVQAREAAHLIDKGIRTSWPRC